MDEGQARVDPWPADGHPSHQDLRPCTFNRWGRGCVEAEASRDRRRSSRSRAPGYDPGALDASQAPALALPQLGMSDATPSVLKHCVLFSYANRSLIGSGECGCYQTPRPGPIDTMRPSWGVGEKGGNAMTRFDRSSVSRYAAAYMAESTTVVATMLPGSARSNRKPWVVSQLPA